MQLRKSSEPNKPILIYVPTFKSTSTKQYNEKNMSQFVFVKVYYSSLYLEQVCYKNINSLLCTNTKNRKRKGKLLQEMKRSPEERHKHTDNYIMGGN